MRGFLKLFMSYWLYLKYIILFMFSLCIVRLPTFLILYCIFYLKKFT